MLQIFRASLVMLVLMTILTGAVYPAVVSGFAWVVFPREVQGSLIVQNGQPVGSHLIGQPFTDPKYFWSRPSATSPVPYNAASSSGSNLGPLNPALRDAVKARVDALRQNDPGNDKAVPVDLVTASASGLDPHISVAAAEYQVPRIARLRGIQETRIRKLVAAHTLGRQLGVLGESRVEVLSLNLALDKLTP